MNKKIISVVVATSVMALSFMGCGSNSGDGTSKSKDEKSDNQIVIGAILPLTGSVSTYGESAKNGAQLCIDEINENGGINGKKVVIKYEDDEGDSTKSINAYDKLVNQENASVIVGPLTSGCANEVGPKATADKIPLITPTGTETNLTTTGGEYVFRTCYIDAVQGQAIAKYATEDLKAKKMAILYNVGSDYSKGIAETIKSEFEKSGGKIVEYASYNDGDKDFSAQLTNVKKSNPDIIALPDYYNVVSLIADQARKAGIEVPFIGGDGWDSPELINIGGDSLEGSIFVNHYSPDDTDELVQNFVNKYKDKYGSNPDAFAALTYSTIQLYQAAIEKAGSTNGDTIKDALVNIDTVTVTGSVKFDKSRNPIKSLSVIKIENGSPKLQEKINP